MAQFTYQERFRTLQGVFDETTNRNLFELISRDHFEELLSPLYVGKESNVFLARKGNGYVIVKIYRQQNADFLRMYDYIKQDPRYEFLKKHRRDIIFAWTQREYKNLIRAKEAGVRVPQPYVVLANILVEEFIGDDDNPAFKIKDQIPKDPKKFFNEIITEVKRLYKTGLVHGDLSVFNILNYQEKPYLIDFSQATLTKNHSSKELLLRDLKNIVKSFAKWGVKANYEEIFKRIVGSE